MISVVSRGGSVDLLYVKIIDFPHETNTLEDANTFPAQNNSFLNTRKMRYTASGLWLWYWGEGNALVSQEDHDANMHSKLTVPTN